MSESAEFSPESPAASSSRKPKVKLLVGAGIGVVVLGCMAGLIALIAQPSAITRAGDACAGAKPLHVFLDGLQETSSPQPEPTESDEPGAFDDLFDGVVSVEDNGTTLIVNTKPDDDDPLGVTSLALDCVYEQLDVPTHIRERVGATRGLDGRQDGAWDGFTASWSYHPNNGANVIIVQD